MLGSVTRNRRANKLEVGKIYNVKKSYLGEDFKMPDFWVRRVGGVSLGRPLEIPEMTQLRSQEKGLQEGSNQAPFRKK
jgi:hypothetical protein